MVEGCSEMVWSTTEVWCIFMMYVVTTCAYWIAGESDWVVLIPDYRRKSSMGMERHEQAKNISKIPVQLLFLLLLLRSNVQLHWAYGPSRIKETNLITI